MNAYKKPYYLSANIKYTSQSEKAARLKYEWRQSQGTMHSQRIESGQCDLSAGTEWLKLKFRLEPPAAADILRIEIEALNNTECWIDDIILSPISNNFNDYFWTGDGDDLSWHDDNNWNKGIYPDSLNHNVVISGPKDAAFIDSDTGSVTVNDLYISREFTLSGGSLSIDTGGELSAMGSLYFGGAPGNLFAANNGTVNINGGIIRGGEITEIRSYGSGHELNLNGGTMDLGTTSGNNVRMGYDANPENVTTINISEGTLNAWNLVLGQSDGSGSHNLNMTGGSINLGSRLHIAWRDSTCHVQFDGGTVSANGIQIYADGDRNGTMDMRGESKLIIRQNWLERINSMIENGRLTAYGGEGYFDVDYDIRNQGMTTVKVKVSPPTDTWWTAQGDGSSWHDDNNWNTGVYPNGSTVHPVVAGQNYNAVIDGATGSVTTGNIYLSHSYFDQGGGTLDIDDGGTLLVDGVLYIGGDGVHNSAEGAVFNINSGGTVEFSTGGQPFRSYGSGHEINLNGGILDLTTTPGSNIRMGYDANPDNVTTININDGTLNAWHIVLGQEDNSGTHNLNMIGGTVNLGSSLVASYRDSICHIQFDGGTIKCDRLYIHNDGGQNGSMDMTGDAELIITRDWVENINNMIIDGRLSAYNGHGSFVIDHDSETDHTTVTVKFLHDIPGDLTGDGIVNIADLNIFVNSWLGSGYVDEQLVADGQVDYLDFALLASNWREDVISF